MNLRFARLPGAVLAASLLTVSFASAQEVWPMPKVLPAVPPGVAQVLEQPKVTAAIAAAEQTLNGHGRLLIRRSGTEPVVRVMAEGEDEQLIRRLVEELCTTIQAAA